jgi:hypothetical protein
VDAVRIERTTPVVDHGANVQPVDEHTQHLALLIDRECRPCLHHVGRLADFVQIADVDWFRLSSRPTLEQSEPRSLVTLALDAFALVLGLVGGHAAENTSAQPVIRSCEIDLSALRHDEDVVLHAEIDEWLQLPRLADQPVLVDCDHGMMPLVRDVIDQAQVVGAFFFG